MFVYLVTTAFALSTVVLVVIYRIFFHPLRNVPGPRLAKVTRLWQILKYWSGNWHEDIVNLHRTYGNVVRIAPNEVSFVDADALKTLYGHGTKAVKSKWYDTWYHSERLGQGIFEMRNPKEHGRRRRDVSRAYAMTSVLQMEQCIQTVADINKEQFSRIASLNQSIDLGFWVTGFTYDIVGELGFGRHFDIVSTGKPYTRFIKAGLAESVITGFTINSNSGHFPGQSYWARSPLVKLLVGDIMLPFLNYGDQLIRERREKSAVERSDMLQYFIEAKTQDGNPISDRSVLSEILNLLGAGADTTAIGIRAILGQLLLDPAAYSKVQAEVDQFYTENDMQGREINYKDLSYQLPRYVPAGGVEIRGHQIPAGTEVAISAWAMNRDTSTFGPDAALWRPERWLEDEQKATFMDSRLTTFGFGARSCIGKNIALVELNKYVAQLLRHFDVSLVNRDHPWNTKSLWFAHQSDMWVNLKNREAGK